jgi:SHS2 domain-containing protein
VVVGGGVLTPPRYEVLPHTADTAIIAYGSTLPEVFENAAFGMFDLMFDLTEVVPTRSRPMVAAGDTPEELLVAWLGELLTEAEIHDLAFSYFTVDRLEEGGVQGSAQGSPATGLELQGPPIKAVTYHDLAVVEIPDGWWARVVFDV